MTLWLLDRFSVDCSETNKKLSLVGRNVLKILQLSRKEQISKQKLAVDFNELTIVLYQSLCWFYNLVFVT